jgi:hypothetical protein
VNLESVQTQRTRAQAIRDKVEIRLAVNEAGPAIEAILKMNGIELQGADWSKVFPSWLIATVDDDVIGCCQVLVSKPVGYVEFMFVRTEHPFQASGHRHSQDDYSVDGDASCRRMPVRRRRGGAKEQEVR